MIMLRLLKYLEREPVGLVSLNLLQHLLNVCRAQVNVKSYSSFLLNGAMVGVLCCTLMPKVASFLWHMDRTK